MPKHPTQGLIGIKPRSQLPGERLPKDENQELSRAYIRGRNKKLTLSITQQEMEIAAGRNELIEKRHLQLQMAYLLTGLRQRILQLPRSLPRQLKDKNEHQMSAVESKCITQGRIKMHHLGRRFSKWISVVVARVKLVMGGESRVFSAGGC